MLDDDAGATNPRAKRRHPPPRNQPQTPAQLREGDVTNLYGWVGIGCGIECVPHTRLRTRETQHQQQDWWRGPRTGPQKLWLRPDDGAW